MKSVNLEIYRGQGRSVPRFAECARAAHVPRRLSDRRPTVEHMIERGVGAECAATLLDALSTRVEQVVANVKVEAVQALKPRQI